MHKHPRSIGIVVDNELGIHDRVVLLIYYEGNREVVVLRSWEAVHSRLMHKYGINIAGSQRGK